MVNEVLTLRGRIVTGSLAIDDGVIAVAGDRISYVGPASEFPGIADLEQNRAAGDGRYTLLPGLVDLHCHGAAGSDFSEGSAAAARSAARFLHRRGTTTLLASLVTASTPTCSGISTPCAPWRRKDSSQGHIWKAPSCRRTTTEPTIPPCYGIPILS